MSQTSFSRGFAAPRGLTQCFISLGRLLALSQRVESGCRSLALHVKMRLDPSPLESEEALREFCDAVWKQKLHQHVAYLASLYGSEFQLCEILNAARIARNEVAHDVTLGFEHWAYDESVMSRESKGIRELATIFARADHLLCTIASVLSKEPLLRGEANRSYQDRLVAWVCDTDNGNRGNLSQAPPTVRLRRQPQLQPALLRLSATLSQYFMTVKWLGLEWPVRDARNKLARNEAKRSKPMLE